VSNIVPFGKYKGQPVEAMAQDVAYCDWAISQDWFRERYANLYTIIVNNFGEAAETPAHNAMQVQFLNDDFCDNFIEAWRPGFLDELEKQAAERIVKACDEELGKLSNKILSAAGVVAHEESETIYWGGGRDTISGVEEGIAKLRRTLTAEKGEEFEAHRSKVLCGGAKIDYRPCSDAETIEAIKEKITRAEEALSKQRKKIEEAVQKEAAVREEAKGDVELLNAAKARRPSYTLSCSFSRDFENTAIDVILIVKATAKDYGERDSDDVMFHIEVKPNVGDDYPAILRQMRTARERLLRQAWEGNGGVRWTPYQYALSSGYLNSALPQHEILFAGEYTGKGATKEQMVQIFKSAGIDVVWQADCQ
jgi:hypothetical protein